jgi:hypothetical protein
VSSTTKKSLDVDTASSFTGIFQVRKPSDAVEERRLEYSYKGIQIRENGEDSSSTFNSFEDDIP